MDNLKITSTSGLLEELARRERYRKSLVAREGLNPYLAAIDAVKAELLERNVTLPTSEDADPAKPCRLQPLADHVVIAPDVAPDVTEGGLIIPETAKEKPMRGTVLAVGPGRTEPGIGTVVPAVKVDDIVLFGRFAGTQVVGIRGDDDNEPVLIMREEDILGILAPEVAE
jgi:chaperonin GroES